MNNETFASCLNVYCQPGKEEAFKDFMIDLLPGTKNYKGCLFVNMSQDRNDKTHFLFNAEWTSETVYNEYLEWRTETGIFEKATSYLTKEPEIWRFDNVFGGYITEKLAHATAI